MRNDPTQLVVASGIQGIICPLQIFNNGHCTTMYNTIPSSGDTTRVAFLSASAELLITNQDLGAVKIQLYDIITRRDTNSTPDTLFQSGETDEGGNGTTFDVIGCLPFSSDSFCTPNRVMSKEVQSRG